MMNLSHPEPDEPLGAGIYAAGICFVSIKHITFSETVRERAGAVYNLGDE